MTEVSISSDARQRVDRIKTAVEVVWHLIMESHEARDWEALGYASWDDMCTREFGTSRLRIPREERAETVQSLRDAGFSIRAISSATGLGKSTIHRELTPVPDGTPEPLLVDHATGEVLDDGPPLTQAECEALDPAPQPPKITGLDGKTYDRPVAPTERKPPRKRPIVDTAVDLGFDIRKVIERLERLVSDDRLRTNEEQVTAALRGHLLYAADTVAAVLDQLPKPQGA